VFRWLRVPAYWLSEQQRNCHGCGTSGSDRNPLLPKISQNAHCKDTTHCNITVLVISSTFHVHGLNKPWHRPSPDNDKDTYLPVWFMLNEALSVHNLSVYIKSCRTNLLVEDAHWRIVGLKNHFWEGCTTDWVLDYVGQNPSVALKKTTLEPAVRIKLMPPNKTS